MEVIKKEEREQGKNNKVCSTVEYSFQNKALDLGIAKITGRFPNKGYCANDICYELLYILKGDGKIFFENKEVSFKEGDAILIYPKEKYYWDSKYCEVAMACNPAWSPDQHLMYEE